MKSYKAVPLKKVLARMSALCANFPRSWGRRDWFLSVSSFLRPRQNSRFNFGHPLVSKDQVRQEFRLVHWAQAGSSHPLYNFGLIVAFAAFLALPGLGDDSISNIEKQLKGRMNGLGIQWLRGKPRILGIEDCESIISVFGNCFGNNPAAPYVGIMVPSLKEEFEDKFYGKTLLFPEEPQEVSFTYRMGGEEAILIMGESPPLGAFFSSQTYLFTRRGEAGPAPLWFGFLPPEIVDTLFVQSPNPQRFISFSSMGDSINNAKMAQSIGSSSGFDQRFYFILTASKNTEQIIRQELIKSGASAERIFVEKIPKSVQLGLDENADDLVTLLRYSLPKSAQMGNSWRETLPISVVRLTPPPGRNPIRFPENSREPRIGNSELGLIFARTQLLIWIEETLAIRGGKEIPSFSSELGGLTGTTCVERNMNCLGDTRDTDSYRFANIGTLSRSEYVVALGVNHTRTSNATYVSMAINNVAENRGVGSVSQTAPEAGFVQGQLNDSLKVFADFYGARIPFLLKDVQGKFYIRVIARSCQGLPVCTEIDENKIPLNVDVSLIQRAYLRPGSTVGPDWKKMLSPVFIRGNRSTVNRENSRR